MGVLIVIAIIGATGLIIQMQRLASIDAFRTATLNLGNGMAQQTTQALKAIDRALLEIQAGVTAAPDATVDDIQSDHAVEIDVRVAGRSAQAASPVDHLASAGR